jgi:dihydroneopterin aldolase
MDTIDYGVIANTVVGIVEGEPVDLIETLAQRIADACLADPKVNKVQVTVHKPDAPISVPFDDVAVTIERSRV